MAYIRSPLQNKQNLGTQESGVIGTGSGGTTQDGAAKSDWTNLNAYIDQNQGAGAGMADEMLKPGQEAVTGLSTAGGNFAKSSENEIGTGTKTDSGGYGNLFKSGDLSKPTPQQTGAYKNWAAAPAYTGPNQASEIGGYGELKTAEGTAKDASGRSQTTGGQYTLAKDTLGKGYGPYSGGMSMLDTVLTRQAGGGQKLDQFNTANTDENISKGVSDITGGIAGKVDAARLAGEKITGDTKSGLQTRLDTTIGNIGKRATGLGGLSTGDMASDAELAALTNMVNMGASSKGYNIGRTENYVSPTQQAALDAQTAKAADAEKARIAGIAKNKADIKAAENAKANAPIPMSEQPGQAGSTTETLPKADTRESPTIMKTQDILNAPDYYAKKVKKWF